MSDKQKGDTALTALDERDRERSNPETSALSVICKDLHSLLSLIYNLSTKLSLALNPSSPTYSASLPLLQDLAKHASGVVYCVSLLNEVQYGATFIKDTTNLVKGILESLRDLVQTFKYLARTAALHDLITTAQGPNGIPNDNRSAVRQHWSVDKATLEDGLAEVSRMIEEAERDDANHPAEEDDFDDGWDELGLGTNTSLSKDELSRAKSVYPILRLTTLLHKRVFLDVISSTCTVPVSNVAYDSLLEQSHSLLEASDELVATLYSPQDPDSVCKEVAALMMVVAALCTRLQAFFPVDDGLDAQVKQLSVQDSLSPKSSRSVGKKWFDTCFDQISRLSANFISPSDG
ncbi:hypothetical protein F5J12DRAFT_903374 [Pisolithus orientalis]|uniref:uncharacterized protein n=1 Tax=Pisolithus orientalis TaxID=936130 RepID=UPI00222444C7|nr:uncharacterized protein F5J12DRAFT_903374 [Pisolithus orientalis]KAI6028400.1 hypothetical protein F5J12DRAFT_903374 [Pisolithus orientalis]